MYSRRTLLVGGVAALFAFARSAPGADTKRFEVDVHEGKVAKRQRTLRVTEGDKVAITFTSDRPIELHLHGIDVTVHVAPGTPSVMAFQAKTAGRFPVEAHGTGRHGGLLYVEVHPR